MKTFEPGTRVKRIETNETGTVDTQFPDGMVFLKLDDGQPAQLYSSSLEEIPAWQPEATSPSPSGGQVG